MKAAQKLRFTDLPVIVCRHWSAEEVSAFRLMPNRSATWAEWDLKAVAQEIAELTKTKLNLKLTGFDAREIEDFLPPVFEEQTLESVPETPNVITSRLARRDRPLTTTEPDLCESCALLRSLVSCAPVLTRFLPRLGFLATGTGLGQRDNSAQQLTWIQTMLAFAPIMECS